MPRAAATFKHDDAVRAAKVFERMGARLGKIITHADGRTEYVPNYADNGENPPQIIDKRDEKSKPLREPME